MDENPVNQSQKPGIPAKYEFVFDAVANGARTFRDLFPDNSEDLIALMESMQDFHEVETRFEEIAEEYGSLDNNAYRDALYLGLMEIWPPKAPDVVNDLRRGFAQKRENIEETNTWCDYQLALELYPEEIQQQVMDLSEEDRDKIRRAFESLGIDFDEELPPANAIKKSLGKLRGPFNKAINDEWPSRRNPKKQKAPKTRADDATELMETHFIYQAVCDLLDGDFTNLDPVIGDEACEARPSLLIDIWEAVNTAYLADPETVDCLKFGYILRHGRDNKLAQIRLSSDILDDSNWSSQFIEWCDGILGNIGPWAPDYLKYCKANSVASTLAADEWSIASYDRNKGIYDTEERAARRAALADLSIERIREVASWVRDQAGDQGGDILEQIIETLNETDAYKEDSGNQVRVLPIYETMRSVVAYECLKARPIILSIYQIRYDENETDPYSLTGVHTLLYKPVNGRFQCVEPEEQDYNRPCMALQGYQLVNPKYPIATDDGVDFFANPDPDEYLDGFLGCDLPFQIMIYSAVHPALPHGGVVNGTDVGDDGGRAVLQEMHAQVCGENPQAVDDIDRSHAFDLLNPGWSLATEYQTLLDLGQRLGLADKQYMKRPGGGQVCVRTEDSCAFTIHHINMQSLQQVTARDVAVLNHGALKRYHNFDKGESFGSMDEAT